MTPDKTALDVVKMGSGPDLMLLHSLLSDRSAFDRIAPRLAAERTVWLINLPGFGASAPAGPGLEQFADRIAEELPKHGLRAKADLLGNGFGGFVSVALAVRHGTRFGKLMFVDTGAAIPPEGKGAFAVMAEKVETGGMEAVLPIALQRMFPEDFLAGHPQIAEERKASLRAANPQHFAAACRALAAFDHRAEIGSIANPSLVLVGLRDTATPPALSYALAKGIPGAQLVELAHCGHFAPHPGSGSILAGAEALSGVDRLMADGGHRPPGWKPRIEDDALLRGEGRFMDDVREESAAFAHFLRSPHAHARIVSVDTKAALAIPGVLGVVTAAEMKSAGARTITHPVPVPGRGGSKLIAPYRPALAEERVLHVGHPVAMIVAETPELAQDAAELVGIDYEILPAVADIRDAIAPGAPQLWPEAPGNVALDFVAPQGAAYDVQRQSVDRAFTAAAHVVQVVELNQRIVVASMETRGGTASYDPVSGTYLLRAPSQSAKILRDQLVGCLDIPLDRLRVLSGDVGGAFGMKTAAYPEYVALLVGAKLLGRPLHWMSSRAESLLSDNQARDTVTTARLALDADGRFLALDVSAIAAVGAFLSSHGASIASNNFARCFPTMYDIPHIAVDVRCVFTNTVQMGPYRGAGRPEANYAVERLIEEAARVTGIDPLDLRRRNLIPRSKIPYASAVETRFDSGDFERLLDKALDRADYAGFAGRRAQSSATGKLRGLGVSCFLEHAGGVPGDEAGVRFPGNETLAVALGMHPSGQGHASLYRRLAAHLLGIDETRVVVHQGDTKLDINGYAAVASRSTTATGSALVRTIELVIEKGRRLASQLMEASEADIEYADGSFRVAGTDRRLSLFEVADRAKSLEETLDTKGQATVPQTFPNGCHIAEVEIDPETGVVTLASYVAVDDCGNVLDPVLVEGQIHGGIAQGVGQALWEEVVFDRQSAQLLTGSFMDYAMPRADDLPMFETASHPVPCTTNPLGVKGTGEAGTTGALAAVMNAIAHAIPGQAGAALTMPATAEKVWRALRA